MRIRWAAANSSSVGRPFGEAPKGAAAARLASRSLAAPPAAWVQEGGCGEALAVREAASVGQSLDDRKEEEAVEGSSSCGGEAGRAVADLSLAAHEKGGGVAEAGAGKGLEGGEHEASRIARVRREGRGGEEGGVVDIIYRRGRLTRREEEDEHVGKTTLEIWFELLSSFSGSGLSRGAVDRERVGVGTEGSGWDNKGRKKRKRYRAG